MQELAEDMEREKQIYYKEKDEPVRLAKGNENIRKGVMHLQNEMDQLGVKKEQLQTLENKEKQLLNTLEGQVIAKKEEVNQQTRKIRDME